MATTTTPKLLQHPSHEHPLVIRDSVEDLRCHLCNRKITANAYTCQERCKSYYYHKVCAEAPPQMYPHPIHPHHPLTLVHSRQPFRCDACDELFYFPGSSFRCNECDFDLDISCALSTISDRGGSPGGTTPECITLQLHSHPLTSFSTRHDFVADVDCIICRASVEGDGDGYMCLRRECEFLIHKRCIRDVYYVDGAKAPRIYHRHPLETFLGEDTGSTRCAKCTFNTKSGEFIGCSRCDVFIHRDCVQLPEIIQFPPHPDHTLVLLMNSTENDKPQCDSCLVSLEGEVCYGCYSCEFFAHVACALQVLSYCEEGTRAEIELSWHEHPLLLCHRTKSDSDYCFYCEDKSAGPMYACKDKGCELLLHKRCTEIETTIIHPHHPDHPLTLCSERIHFQGCKACSQPIFFLKFSCKICEFYLHAKCAAHVANRKHYLHEHELLCLDKPTYCECNRCGARTSSRFFRCVPCDFNLHEECMELPPKVVNSKVHWHPLTLHETYIEDDSGEYYCDQCEKRRDNRMGVYVCLQCSARWAYHIECVFPELQKLFMKDNAIAIERLTDEIARGEEEVREVERKLDEMKRELEEKRKKCAALSIIK